MALNFQTIRDAFPFIRQVISDAYKMDIFLFSWPYEDTDRLDRGFRKMMWGKKDRPAFFDQFLSDPSDHQMVVMKSSLGFYNIFASVLLDEKPDFIAAGPFGDGEITDVFIQQIARSQGLNPEQVVMVKRFYEILPEADANDAAMMLLHLLSAFIPAYHNVSPQYISYSEITHKFTPNTDAFRRFTTVTAEYYAAYLNELLDTMATGDYKKALDRLKNCLDAIGFTKITSLHILKKKLHELNSLCKGKLMTTSVHPYYSLNLSDSFAVRIDSCSRYEELLSMPYKMIRRYCMLIKNHSHRDYPYLIRSIMAYIDEHIDEELSLSVLAEVFQRNASSLSDQFRKETGETLTEYIHKERIQTAIQYFNTTGLSVSEVAASVGITNFAYFSRLFKKQVGMSPREYRRMVKS